MQWQKRGTFLSLPISRGNKENHRMIKVGSPRSLSPTLLQAPSYKLNHSTVLHQVVSGTLLGMVTSAVSWAAYSSA